MSIEFEQEKVEAWVKLCEEESKLRANNASESEIKALQIKILQDMVNLLPRMSEDEKCNLVLHLQSQSQSDDSKQVDHIECEKINDDH